VSLQAVEVEVQRGAQGVYVCVTRDVFSDGTVAEERVERDLVGASTFLSHSAPGADAVRVADDLRAELRAVSLETHEDRARRHQRQHRALHGR